MVRQLMVHAGPSPSNEMPVPLIYRHDMSVLTLPLNTSPSIQSHSEDSFSDSFCLSHKGHVSNTGLLHTFGDGGQSFWKLPSASLMTWFMCLKRLQWGQSAANELVKLYFFPAHRHTARGDLPDPQQHSFRSAEGNLGVHPSSGSRRLSAPWPLCFSSRSQPLDPRAQLSKPENASSVSSVCSKRTGGTSWNYGLFKNPPLHLTTSPPAPRLVTLRDGWAWAGTAK